MMMDPYTPRVDDLLLFFRDDDGSLAKRLIPHHVYADESRRISLESLAPGFRGSVISEQGDEAEPYYVANFARLLAPGTSPFKPVARRPPSVEPAADRAPKVTPRPSDIVVVPHDNPNAGYILPRDVYRDCVALSDQDIPDVVTMAIEEGVVLANLPKLQLDGLTCYLLSLISLRSGALDAATAPIAP
jgi:hypothetical protein